MTIQETCWPGGKRIVVGVGVLFETWVGKASSYFSQVMIPRSGAVDVVVRISAQNFIDTQNSICCSKQVHNSTTYCGTIDAAIAHRRRRGWRGAGRRTRRSAFRARRSRRARDRRPRRGGPRQRVPRPHLPAAGRRRVERRAVHIARDRQPAHRGQSLRRTSRRPTTSPRGSTLCCVVGRALPRASTTAAVWAWSILISTKLYADGSMGLLPGPHPHKWWGRPRRGHVRP